MKITIRELKQIIKEQVDEAEVPKKLTKAQERSWASRVAREQRDREKWEAYSAERDRIHAEETKKKKDARSAVPSAARMEELEEKVEQLENEVASLNSSVQDLESRLRDIERQSERDQY